MVDSASNRNEYQKHFLGGKGGRCVRLTTLPPSCAVVTKSGNLNFLEASGTVQTCNGTALPFVVTIIPTIATAHRLPIVTMIIILVTKTQNSLRDASLVPNNTSSHAYQISVTNCRKLKITNTMWLRMACYSYQISLKLVKWYSISE